MAVLKHGWSEQIALSLFTKETAYDTLPTINATNYCSLNGFDAEVTWPDTFENDKGEVTGKEHGFDQYRVTQETAFTVAEKHAKPNTLAGLGQLALGSAAVTKDGAFNAWRHILTPIAVGSALPSIGVVHQKGGLQYKYSGVKCNSLTLSGEVGMACKLSAELIGSGTRSTDATSFPASITEEWMLVRNCKVWMESGADIAISTVTQGTEDISSATPDALDARMKSFMWKWNNNLERQSNFGSLTGAARDIDKGRRSAEFSLGLTFDSSTELTYFINQDPMAVEVDLAGSVVIAGSSYKYGAQLVIPRFKIKSAPVATGGVDDRLELTIEAEIFDDGTNAASILSVFTGKSAYLA